MSIDLHYLVILDSQDRPLLFKSYQEGEDDLGIQLHCYASLDFLEQKLQSRLQQYLGQIYTIYNGEGQFSIHAFYTATKTKVLAIFKELGPGKTIVEEEVSSFCSNVYKLYKRHTLQAFSVFEATGRFSQRFYEQLDSYATKAKFRSVEKPIK